MSAEELSPVFPLREEPLVLKPETSLQSPQEDGNFFRNIVAYVEVRSQADNRSRAIAQELRDLGVTVCDRLGPNITHIVYRQGCRRTVQWAERHDVPLVSVSWIQACKTARKLLPTVRFPAEPAVDGYSPGLHARRRMRSMQPKSFEEDLKLSSERKRRAARRNHRRNELRQRAAEAEQQLWSCENGGEDDGRKPDNYFADPHIYVAKTPPSMKEFVERRGRRYSMTSADNVSPVPTPPKHLLLDSAAESNSKTLSKKPEEFNELEPPDTPLSSLRSPRRKLNLGGTSMEETPSSLSSTISQRSLMCPARKLFDAATFSGILIEPKTSSNRLQSMCSVFPKAFQKRKIIGSAEDRKAQRKRNRHSEQPLTKSSFLFDDSGEESETDVKVDQEAVMISRRTERCPTPEPATICLREPPKVTPKPIILTSMSSPSSSVESVSEADICSLIRDCSRRDRRSRISVAFKSTDAAPLNEAAPLTKTDESMVSQESSTTSSSEQNSSVQTLRKNSSSIENDGIIKKPVKKVHTPKDSHSPSLTKSRRSIPSSRRSFSTRNSVKNSLDELPESASKKVHAPTESLSPSSTKTRRSIPSSRRSFSTRSSVKNSTNELSVSKSITSQYSMSESTGMCQNNNNSTMTSLSERMLDLLKRPSSRRSTRASFAALSSSSGSSSPLTATSRRMSVRLQATAARMAEESPPQTKVKSVVEQSNLKRLTAPRGSETQSNSPTPLPVVSKRTSGKQQWSNLVSQDSSSSSISSPFAPRRTRSSLDDFRPVPFHRKTETAPRKGKGLLRTKRYIVPTSLHKKQQNAVTNAIRVLGGAILREKVDKTSTTHIITCWPLRRTLNLLRARLLGLPVVRFDWLLESREAGRWLPEDKYLIEEACDTKNSPSAQKIFEECGTIFVSPQVSPPQRELMDIIKLAGGQISGTPEDARIVIKSVKDSSPTVDPKWVLDSITAREALPLKDYLRQD